MSTEQGQLQKVRIVYNDNATRWFIWASIGWGIVGMLVGVIVALQMGLHQANVHEYLSFGRLRPLHTNAVVFAFVGNMVFAGIYYSTQRLVKARLASDLLTKIHFWGWQAIIVSAAITLPLGYTQSKEYAELEWPIDIAIAVIWVVFAVNFFWTLARRAEKHLYVAVWFYIATIITVAVLHIVNSLAIPVGPLKSYSIFPGAKDALVQWWYGHNAVAFFLTTPILGIMYYFVPKAAERPVYSYRLSIIHFWALVFLYIWAGPHHLLNTALPAWAQTLGMIFSIMLWAPSWGGMINGLFTIRGAWDRLRSDPILKFFAAALTFYGMATFEGPLLSIRSVNAIAHYTDWIIGHVHAGALGWNGFMAAGMFYYLVPKLYGRELFSRKLANLHFYLGTFGILFYVIAMYVSAATQGGMWRATDATGALVYGGWVETVVAILPLYWMRLAGGTAYLVGMIIMAYNLYRTARAGAPVVAEAEVVVPVTQPNEIPWTKLVFGRPVMLVTLVAVLFGSTAVLNESASIFMASAGIFAAILGTLAYSLTREHGEAAWHRVLEGRAMLFTSLTVIAVLIGGVAELIPVVAIGIPKNEGQKPYSALELEGRDVYIREGCVGCHSQQIRPLAWETARFGEPSTLAESSYDHPFLWGSKRTGPDLAREGARNPDALWHYRHMLNPREISQGSNMPAYPHLKYREIDLSATVAKLRAMRSVGVPYTASDIQVAQSHATTQGEEIATSLRKQGADVNPRSEMIALIAYLQCLGRPKTEAQKTDAVTQR